MTGEVSDVKIGVFKRYVLVNGEGARQGITLGPYINGWGIRDDFKKDPLFVHEYGHTIQSKLLGSLYLKKIGLPSGLSGLFDDFEVGGTGILNDLGFNAHNHDNTWFEINANQFGNVFFNPTYSSSAQKNNYSTTFSRIDWDWFALFNPFIF